MNPVLTGSCACHHITYSTTKPPQNIINCHCTTCRKQSGGPYQSWATFAPGTITWNRAPSFRRSSDFATRGFCPRCGSSVSMEYDYEPGAVNVTAGTIDETSRVKLPKPSSHLFLREKAAWFDLLEDGVERWDGFTPEMSKGLKGLQRKSD